MECSWFIKLILTSKHAFMTKHYCIFLILVVFLGCNNSEEKESAFKEINPIEIVDKPTLSLEQAKRLAELPLNCMDTEYPNKLNQTIGSTSQI